MAQFPMGRNTGRNFPVRSTDLDDLLISLLEQQQMTTPEENVRQRLESLRRADAGTSPLKARLYESLYKTGPVYGEMTVDQQRMPASVANSAFSGSTGYAKQGPPTPVGLESRLAGRDQFGYGIPASVANSIGQSQSPFFQQPSESQNKLAVAAVESAMRAGDYEPYGPTQEQMKQGGLILEGERRREANPLQISGAIQRGRKSSIDPLIQQPSMDTVEEGEISPVSEGVEVSLLERLGNTGIGRALRDNPELAAMGAQLAGGLISNAAQNRAQRQADRTNQQRTARSNLISALTGGRVRPDVERAQADTGGILSLNTLGQALRGGGAMVQGELARRVEEAERERRAGLEERAASVAEKRAETQEQSRIDTDAYRDRLLTLKERGLRADALKSLQLGEPKETPDKQTRNEYKAMSRILRQVDNVEDLLRDAGFFQKGSGLKLLQIAGLDEGLPQFMGGEKTRELKAAVNNLVQTLGEGLSGVLSDRDIEFLRQQAIKETDSLDTAMLKAQQIRNRLSQNIRENFEIDSQYFNMEPYRDLVDLVEASGEQGEGSFIRDLAGASLNLD